MISLLVDYLYAIAHTIKSFIGLLKICFFSLFFNVKTYKLEHNEFKNNFYILGSGESIKSLENTQIKNDLANSTSIGINFWLYHDYVPDLYFFEINGSDTYSWELFCKIIDLKKDEYKNTIFIIRDIEKLTFKEVSIIRLFPHELRSNLRFSLDFDLGKGTSRRFIFTAWIVKNIFNFKNVLPKSRGSLSSAFSIGLQSTSKNIILVGCDLSGSNYHLARDYVSSKYKNLPQIKTIRQNKKTIHKTNDKEFGLPLISDVILYFSQYSNKKIIFNINNNGFFSKHYKIWDDESFNRK
jgi:hypothetical protein